MMAKNAAPWPKMIRAVYESLGTGRHQGDATARRVMDRAVSWLVAGLELSPRLQASVIDNINMRTAHRVEQPGRPISLTRHQIAYARRTNPEWFGLGLDGEDEPAETVLKEADLSAAIPLAETAIQQVFSNLSASIQQSFSSFSALFPNDALALAQHLVSMAAENSGSDTTYSLPMNPKVMKREANGSNHEPGMILASPALALHDQEVADAEVHAPQADEDQGAYRDGGGSHCQDDNAHRGTHVGKSHRPSLTLWVKTDTRGDLHATGFFDRDGVKHALRFTAFDHALERIGAADADWHGFVNRDIGPCVLPQERAATGIAGKATMSGLYDSKDTWARKAPLFIDKAVALNWSGDVPTSAFLIEGQKITELMLRPETSDRYKGMI